jgi:hypothetical protein
MECNPCAQGRFPGCAPGDGAYCAGRITKEAIP